MGADELAEADRDDRMSDERLAEIAEYAGKLDAERILGASDGMIYDLYLEVQRLKKLEVASRRLVRKLTEYSRILSRVRATPGLSAQLMRLGWSGLYFGKRLP